MTSQIRLAVSVGSLALVVACGGGGDGSTGPGPQSKPVASVTVSPPSLNLLVGQSGTLAAQVKDASGSVVSGRAITWSVSDAAIATVSTAGVVTAVTRGNAIVTATSEGKSGTASVTVSLVPAASVEVTPPAATLYPTQTRQFTATTKDSVGGVLSGLSVAWATSNGAVATVSSSGLLTAVAAGSATVSAMVGGKTATASISVINPPANGGNSTWSFANCHNDLKPIWFAFQDGTGAWTQSAGTNDGVYTFNISQSIGGVAFVIGDEGGGYGVTTAFMTQAELQGGGVITFQSMAWAGGSSCPINAATKTLNGSVAGVGLTEMAMIGSNVADGSSARVLGASTPTFQLERVPTGVTDLFASRGVIDVGTGFMTPNQFIIRRGTNYPDGSTIPVLDFNGTEAFAPATATLTATNLGADDAFAILLYRTSNGTGLFAPASSLTGAPKTMYGVPAARQLADDLHQLNVFRADQAGTRTVAYTTFFKTLANKAVDMGALLTVPTITTLATTPYPRYRAAAAIQPEYGSLFVASFDGTTTGANARGWLVTATRGYFGAAASYNLTIADLAGVGGWNNTWALLTSQATFDILAAGWAGNGIPIEGAVSREASRHGGTVP